MKSWASYFVPLRLHLEGKVRRSRPLSRFRKCTPLPLFLPLSLFLPLLLFESLEYCFSVLFSRRVKINNREGHDYSSHTRVADQVPVTATVKSNLWGTIPGTSTCSVPVNRKPNQIHGVPNRGSLYKCYISIHYSVPISLFKKIYYLSIKTHRYVPKSCSGHSRWPSNRHKPAKYAYNIFIA